jgi:hypothetical protein
MRATLVLAAGLLWLGCSSNSPAPSSNGAAGRGSAGQDGAVDSKADGAGGMDAPAPPDGAAGRDTADASDAPATACPPDQPQFGATCTGTLSCEYGHSSCCGIQTSAQTCTCRFGFFDCAQTVECNFICPDAGLG